MTKRLKVRDDAEAARALRAPDILRLAEAALQALQALRQAEAAALFEDEDCTLEGAEHAIALVRHRAERTCAQTL